MRIQNHDYFVRSSTIEQASLRSEMRVACVALSKLSESQAKLVGAAYRTHAETTAGGNDGSGRSPESFLEVVCMIHFRVGVLLTLPFIWFQT